MITIMKLMIKIKTLAEEKQIILLIYYIIYYNYEDTTLSNMQHKHCIH